MNRTARCCSHIIFCGLLMIVCVVLAFSLFADGLWFPAGVLTLGATAWNYQLINEIVKISGEDA